MPHKDPERRREYHKKYREDHRAERREYERKYYPLNREKRRVIGRKSYLKHRERKLAQNHKWIEDHLEQHREMCKNWNKTHPEERRIYSLNRRARVNGARGEFTQEEEYELFAWQRGDCHYCGEFLYLDMPYHIDHKTPISRGGSNTIDNIALTCPSCNFKKNAKTEEEFMSGRRK